LGLFVTQRTLSAYFDRRKFMTLIACRRRV